MMDGGRKRNCSLVRSFSFSRQRVRTKLASCSRKASHRCSKLRDGGQDHLPLATRQGTYPCRSLFRNSSHFDIVVCDAVCEIIRQQAAHDDCWLLLCFCQLTWQIWMMGGKEMIGNYRAQSAMQADIASKSDEASPYALLEIGDPPSIRIID